MTLTKRLCDLMLLLILGVVLVPVLGLLVLVLMQVQGRPVLFGSRRTHAPGRDFTLWKLRSMTQDAGDAGVSGGDKQGRITPMGRILRRSRMDELPQLWNILRGDISFVGPRPPLPDYVARCPELYARVLRSRPGVTGLASLVFAAHEEAILSHCKTSLDTDAAYVRRCIPRKARIDLLYQRHQSLGLDLWLIIVTGGRALGLMRRGPRLPRLRPRYVLHREAYDPPICGRIPTIPGSEKSSIGCKGDVVISLTQKEQDQKHP
jgi:lipopolysaccharide/colanic/teichoic acid biosynthesis glycosyltransferase